MTTPRRGDIILCYNKWSPISFLIRSIEKCPWSHVAWVVSDTEAIEALGKGVTRSPLSKFKNSANGNKKYMFVRIKPEYISPGQLDKAVSLAELDEGHKYEWVRIFRLLFAWALGLRHSAPISGPTKEEICSELIAENLYAVSGFVFRTDVPWQNAAPCDMSPERSKKVEVVGQG